MKKIFMIFVFCAAMVTSASARETVEGSKLFDNWSLGVAGGAYTPMKGHAFFNSMRPTVNLTLAKQITPIYGLGIEGASIINGKTLTGRYSANAFDGLTVNILNYFNLNNLFSQYKGSPRPLEVVAFWGLGWGHEFYVNRDDLNFADMKSGLSFNFNLSKALQFNIKPAVTWNLEGGHYAGTPSNSKYNDLKNDINHSAFEITAGFTYKFCNSNGTHNFKIAHLYDQAEVDGLNAKINDLRNDINHKNSQLTDKQEAIKTLQEQLNDCRNKAPQVIRETKTNNELESVVTFAQGKSMIDRSQFPNVERIATYLKNHKDSRVIIKGYASPEGGTAINAKLAKDRAEAVKAILTNKYHISSSRIQAEGQGVGNMFSEPDWNRVSISTIEK
ncbi:MAG: OmpA family protein [Bacteroidaceae bacterium]|jgi:outer membrane protein OmpA-like peptidoglycan-associated protein